MVHPRFARFLLPFVLALVSTANALPLFTPRFTERVFRKRPLCSFTRPDCGLTIEQAQRRYLSSYVSIKRKLWRIKRRSRVPIIVGPLIKNGNNDGMLDIDVPIDKSLAPAVNISICGENITPTIRDAVICTVTKNPVSQRGNKVASNIGRSNLGREILAVRIPRKNAPRVLVVTQLHGNEAASTDAALKFLMHHTRRWKYEFSNIDLLFVIRANVDGGEPTARRDDIPPLGGSTSNRQLFYRYNIDPTAGIPPTEPGFFGIVNQGYNLNRYNYGGLQDAIRPVESQAMVSALLAYKPQFVFDLHGDVQKVICELDQTSLIPPNTTGGFALPTIKCKNDVRVPTLLNNRTAMVLGSYFADDATALSGDQFASLQSGPQHETRRLITRTIAARVINKLSPRMDGSLTRFSQLILGTGQSGFPDGTMDRGAFAIGAVGSGWEVANFVPEVRPIVSAISATGQVRTGVGPFDIEPCFLRDNICIHQQILEQTLIETAKLVYMNVTDDGGFCDIPLESGVTINTPKDAFPPDLASNGVVVLPTTGIGALERETSGSCPNDDVKK